ncbi:MULTISPECIES: hypothetical protein [Acinetobacter]|uniref:hypothetical protein n=1 Tax=Acinetobacter TaxID=469 RepID=UPI000CFE9C39|nr:MULTISPECIES: hypothetical protein [Acinetobacter]MCS4296856.1 hypothetical protein [Acinetobacter guillouiae]MCW2250978.1 hypothetical protein [Acinetobacter sp. BIGb0204]NII36924.1 hypothetical protein [Acinetobacter sp. BIGb0196]QLD60154.1 hypothetical protein CQZ96_002310 [Acinetobacter sp. MYb10]
MKNILIALCFNLLFCNSVFANSPFSPTKISGLVVHDNGTDIIIELKANVATGEGCQITNQVVLRKTHPLFKEVYAALLSAFHSQTVIQGWINGCHTIGERRPILTRLDLKK